MSNEAMRSMAGELDRLTDFKDEARLEEERQSLNKIIGDLAMTGQSGHFEVPVVDCIKYFTFIQRLFELNDLKEAAEFFVIMKVGEQEKFYDMMIDFCNPVNEMARERV